MRASTPVRAAVALGAVLLLASCGTAAPDPGSSSGGDDAKINLDAKVVVSGQVAPSHLDPHRGVTENDLGTLRYMYDTLTTVVGAGEPAPFLAESWELSEDGSTFTMKLREDVTFSDGEAFNAAAVVANFDRMTTDPNSTVAYILAPIIASSEVVDEYTVQLNLKAPGGALPTILASRSGMMVSPKALADSESLALVPAGAGAFDLVDSIPGSRYSMERRADYWDDKAYQFAKLEYTVQVDTSTALNAVKAGESNVASVVGPQTQEAEASGLKVWKREEPSTSFARLSLNSERSEFGSKEVRQALNAAINRQAIADSLYSGQCVPSAQPYPEGYFAHSTTLDDKAWSTYDVDFAKELLAKAGVPDGFSFTAVVPTLAIYNNTALVIQADLAKVGIDMKLEVLDATQARQAFVTGSADALVGLFGGATDPTLYALSAYNPNSGDNPGGLTTPNMAALITDTQLSDDIAERGKAYEALMEEVFEMGPAQIVLCAPLGIVATTPNVHDYAQNGPLGGPYGLRPAWLSE